MRWYTEYFQFTILEGTKMKTRIWYFIESNFFKHEFFKIKDSIPSLMSNYFLK